MHATIQTIFDRWIDAERQNDAHPLADVLTDDFQFVGPAGFILNREQFLGRFDSGDLQTTSFDISGLTLREHDQLALAIGIWTQETTFQHRSNTGNFRLTAVFAGNGDDWQVINAQLSPMRDPV